MKKLSNCEPAWKLLLLSGFEAKQNNKRLIWVDTNDNMNILKQIQNALESITDTATTTKNIGVSNQPQYAAQNPQTQEDLVGMISDLLLNQSSVKMIHHAIILSSFLPSADDCLCIKEQWRYRLLWKKSNQITNHHQQL